MGEQVGSGVNSQGKLGWSFSGDGGRGVGVWMGYRVELEPAANLHPRSQKPDFDKTPTVGREIVLLICIAVVGKPDRKQALNS
jgi:hypothetical protein